MPKRPLVFPWAGRSDATALHAQPELTTRQAQNVRARNPKNGRLMGAQRAGSVKFNATALGAGKVRALCSTAIDDRKVSYSYSSGAVDDVWGEPTPTKEDCLGGCTDRQGNVYALDGKAGVAKFNSAGHLVMKVALPVEDPAHIVRAIFVDDADRIFAGVSEGGDQAKARIFCVLQRPQPGQVAADDPNQYFVLWSFAPGGYTEALRVFRGSQLYAAHNYPDENRARIVVYEGLGLEPSEAKRIEGSVPFPVHGMDVGPDGASYCTAPTNGGSANGHYRSGFPGLQGSYHPPVVGWTPLDLDNAQARIWSWYDALDLDESDLDQSARDVASLDDGQVVLRLRDKTKNGRHWYAGSVTGISGEAGPTYAKHGPGGLPAVRFLNVGTVKQSMTTLSNPSIDKAAATQQRTAIPQYTGGMFAMFMLLRITEDTGPGSPAPRLVFYADNEATGASDHALWINRACGAVQPGTFDSNNISYYATTDTADDGQCAAADQPLDAAYGGENTNCVLVTVLWDGGVDPNDTTKTRCLVRINGVPVDRFEGLALASVQPNWLGYAPTIATAVANRFNGELCEMLVLDRIDRFDDSTEPKVATHDQLETGSTPQAQTNNEVARIEAYMMGKRGLGRLLPNQGNAFPHYYRTQDSLARFSVPDPETEDRSLAYEAVIRAYPLVTKHNVDGRLVWACNGTTHPDGLVAGRWGGLGYGVAVRKVESDGLTHVWMCGPPSATTIDGTTGDVDLRKIIDLGTTFSGASADGAWRHSLAGGSDLEYEFARIASDKFGNLFFPGFKDASGGTQRPLHAFEKDPDGSGLAVQLFEFLFPGNSFQAYGVALPPDALTPDYRGDAEIAEAVYVFTRTAEVGAENSVYRVQVVTTNSVASGSPRTVVTLGVSGTDIKTIDAGAIAIPSGGSGVIDGTSEYVEAFQADREIVVLDGLRYWSYDALAGTVAALASTSAGEIPPRAKLGCMWRHRLVLARFADKPGRYAASAIGNIRDWDLRREPRLSTMAFDASLTRAGEVEDVIVALMPYSDDLLFVFGESRILRLTGDPMDGGQIDKVSDDIGGTFGRSWCKDTEGRGFFFGNPPGLYGIGAEGVTPLSRYTLEETEFQAIDFATHRIELVWDPVQKGIHIFQVPHGAGGTVVAHWFWEERTHRLVQGGALWTDRYAVSGKQPTAATFLAGDSNRGLLLGCEDGYVRIVDKDARDDDGSAIDSFVLMGPVNQSEEMLEHKLISTQVALQGDMQGCRLELFGSEELEDIGAIVAATDLTAGLNDQFRARVRAPYIWARLRSALANRSWALERGECEFLAVSQQRNRST